MKLFSFTLKSPVWRPFIGPFFLVICPLPLIWFVFSFVAQMNKLSFFEEKIERLHHRDELVQSTQQSEQIFLEKIKRADRFYMNKHIETLPLLEQEVKKLQMLASHGDNESAKHRLHALTKGSNQLQFQQVMMKKSDVIQETEIAQKHPVEMNELDLKRVLSLIEGKAIDYFTPEDRSPQLVIKDFQLSKKNTSGADHIYSVQMQLIKRESAE